MTDHDDDAGEWLELSREDALAWLRTPPHIESDDELPLESVTRVRRLEEHGYEIRVDHADGSSWTVVEAYGSDAHEYIRERFERYVEEFGRNDDTEHDV